MPSSSSLSYVPCRVPAVISRLGRSIDSWMSEPCFFSSVCTQPARQRANQWAARQVR